MPPTTVAETAPDADAVRRRRVRFVALANLAWFGVEFGVARRIGSVALFADSIDFLEDAAVNGLIVLALGWSMARRARVGLVLADPQLAEVGAPGGDRWAGLEEIRALARGAPVVIFTAHGESDFADYEARGFAELLRKPFDFDELLAVARRYVPARGHSGP